MLSIWLSPKFCHLERDKPFSNNPRLLPVSNISPKKNHSGNTEITHNKQFLLFPQCFPKAFYFNVLKRVYMEERVNSISKDAMCIKKDRKH